jgi:hypothetical protein
MFHSEYNILAHEFCIGAPILILTKQVCAASTWVICLSNKFSNNICTSGQWNHNLVFDALT